MKEQTQEALGGQEETIEESSFTRRSAPVIITQ
jgi:hypothetical protein